MADGVNMGDMMVLMARFTILSIKRIFLDNGKNGNGGLIRIREKSP